MATPDEITAAAQQVFDRFTHGEIAYEGLLCNRIRMQQMADKGQGAAPKTPKRSAPTPPWMPIQSAARPSSTTCFNDRDGGHVPPEETTMQHTKTETHITLTLTFRELLDMASCGWKIYATPTPQGDAAEIYIASQPRFRDDFLLATEQDFDDEAGYDITGGWQEMEQHEIDAQADEQYTCTVPRRRRGEER